MRLTLIAFFLLLSQTAEARDCALPRLDAGGIHGLRSFSECVLAEIADLRRDRSRLERRVEELEKALAEVPGEFQNDGGRTTRLGGPRLAQARFSIAARTREGASALPVDQDVVEELCATGCAVTMFLVAEGLRAADPAPVLALGPCAFRYGPESGAWAQSGACGGPASGTDGNGAPTGISGGEILAEAGSACLLADSDLNRSLSPGAPLLGRDNARGLYLIADPAAWTGAEDRFRCELTITR